MISILISVKNEEKHLLGCLESIQNQSLKNWELILVDDHSLDQSFTMMEKWAKNDDRIQVVKNKGVGIIDALQTAYQLSSGELITRMDADDLMHPKKLEVMVDQMKTEGIGHVATSLVEYFSEEGVKDGFKKYEMWLNGLSQTGSNFNDIYKECVIPSPSWMIYREDLDAINGFEDLEYPEDYHLVFKMYEAGLKVIPSEQVLHYWRDHPDRASRNDSNYSDNTFIPLKVKYFLKVDHKEDQTLVLWGAGTKGKKIAQLLLQKEINFKWVCDNPKKWGKDIYGEKMQSPQEISRTKTQVIVAVANPDEQIEIQRFLQSTDTSPYFFC